jgi:tetratricopeptide (TPR) repeat protein
MRRVHVRTVLVVSRLAFGLVMLGAPLPAQADPSASSAEPRAKSTEAQTAEAGADSPAAKTAARDAFASGLNLARTGHYREAKAKFLEAYALAPHPIVAYNAALACVALGERDHAIELLDRALQHSDEIAATELEAIRATRSSLAPPATELPPTVPATRAVAAPAGALAVAPTLAPPAASPVRRDPLAEPREPPVSPSHSPSSSTLGYVIGAAGLVVLAGSGALYLWNDARYGRWQGENATLESRRDALLAAGQVPSQDAELAQRATENDALLRSIQTVDMVDVVMAVTGLVGLGAGAYLTFRGERSSVTVALGPRLTLDARF